MIDKKKYMENLISEYYRMIYQPMNGPYQRRSWKVRKLIIGYRRQYQVCRNGLVYNRITKKWLIPQQHKNGYVYVVLYVDGKRKNVYLHRLIAEYFVRNPMPSHLDVVYHLDGDKWNNRVNNIEWTSKSLLMREYNPECIPILQKDINRARDAKFRSIKRREERKREW